jgi:thiamine biosynthesis lipoprotein
MENGKKYAHIIDPVTGFPVQHSLLSVTVIASDCMTADAYATALMVMGLEKSKTFLSLHPELGAFLIYDHNGSFETFVTDNIAASVIRQ